MFDTTLTALALISADRETLDGVKTYFERAGARVRTTSRLDEAEDASAGADVVVFFADDYSPEESDGVLSDLAVRLLVIVTAESAAFNARRESWSRAGRVVVLPRPAWGWVLLETVRLGLGDRSGRT